MDKKNVNYDTEKEQLQFFYLRRPMNGGQHRVGAVALRINYDLSTNELNNTVFSMAASVCSDNDKFSVQYAKNSAMGRLNSEDYVYNFTRDDRFQPDLESALSACGVRSKSENFREIGNNGRNQLAFERALDTLQGIRRD